MQECSVVAHKIETASSQAALAAASGKAAVKEYAAYVGLDVHKETIAIAVASPGAGSRCIVERSPTRRRRSSG
jgi:hypothetical protein